MAQHKKAPQHRFTLELRTHKGVKTGWNKTVISRNTAFAVALEHFADAHPGEHYEGNTYRYYSPTWGWVYVTVGDEV